MNGKQGSKIQLWLLPLALIYGFVVKIRNKLYDSGAFKAHKFPFPIISVGNISVGGTGKTPVVEYVLDLLSPKFKMAVLSRGYKRKTKGYLEVKAKSIPSATGDEPLQIKKKFSKSIVAVCEKRVEGTRILKLKHPDIKGIVLDDAFQHRAIVPGLSILLIDYNRLITRDYYLPAGRLRESSNEMRRAHIIIITKCPQELTPIEKRLLVKEIKTYPYQKLFFSSLNYKNPVALFKDAKDLDYASLKKSKNPIVLITGIAQSLHLLNFVKTFGDIHKHLDFSDHHHYTSKDVQSIAQIVNALNVKNNSPFILTTEKDAVKLKELDLPKSIKKSIYSIPIGIDFLYPDEKKEFDSLLMNYVKKNKREQLLYN